MTTSLPTAMDYIYQRWLESIEGASPPGPGPPVKAQTKPPPPQKMNWYNA
jgi:hypothetical protein